MIGGSTRIPKIQNLIGNLFNDRKINFTINPDEAVAYGAAVQAAIMTNTCYAEVQHIKLFDVVPLSLGIKANAEHLMINVIERNSQVPCKKIHIFTTAADQQTGAAICIYEGERIRVEDNYFLGEFQIAGLTRALKGQTQIVVTFDLDADGILTVTAKEPGKENEKEMKIDKKNGTLTSADVRRMLADAEKYRKIDEKFKAKAQARQQLDECIMQYETAIAENSSFMPPAKRTKIQEICIEKSRWLQSNKDAGKEAIDEQIEDLKNGVE
jgi:heat shock 70kDa protein 1/2/6/8